MSAFLAGFFGAWGALSGLLLYAMLTASFWAARDALRRRRRR